MQLFPNTLVRPSRKAFENRIPFAQFAGQIAPLCSCTHDPIYVPRLWAIVAYDTSNDWTLTLLTNVTLLSIADVCSVYNDWRLRSRIEHGYRFDQEQGLDVEDMRVDILERMMRLFILVLAAVFALCNAPRDAITTKSCRHTAAFTFKPVTIGLNWVIFYTISLSLTGRFSI